MQMAMLAEVRRIVGSVCRTGAVRSEVSTLFKSRPTHRSTSLNKDVACIAVAPYSIRESCTMLRKQTDTFHEVQDVPEIGLMQSKNHLLDCKEVSTLTNLKDILEVLPNSSEELSSLVDSICDAQQQVAKSYSSGDWKNGDAENLLILALEQRLLDGIQLDRLFSIDNESLTLKYIQESKFDQGAADQSEHLPHILRTPSLDELLFSKPANILGHVLLCDSGASSTSRSNKKDSRLPTEAELDLIRQHLTNYMPHMFMRRHDYRIYTPDIIFENNFVENPYVTVGLTPYVLFLAKCRVYAHFKYANVKMHILKATIHQEDGSVRVRWRVSGIPQIRAFMFWKFMPWRYKDALKEESEWIDGFSTFYVQPKSGLVYKHRLDKVIPDDELLVKEKTKLDKLREMVAPV